MRKAIWALPLATALAVAVGSPVAYAATSQNTQPIHFNQSADSQFTSNTMHAGDCSMDAQLAIDHPSPSGSARVHFIFVTSTSHTTNFDQWHSTWAFLRPDGAELARIGPIDGLRMNLVNHTYTGQIDTVVSFSEATWRAMTQAVWIGSC